MFITATPHYDNILGKGYYLVSEYFDEIWYKGDTANEAVMSLAKEHGLNTKKITILEEV